MGRESALEAFDDYVAAYDPADPKIALKIAHTYRVADLCDRIARAQGWCEEDVDLAWLCGLVHDIGRFEQVRRYGTFSDGKSESHAKIGVEVLFGAGGAGGEGRGDADDRGSIRRFSDDRTQDALVRAAVAYHSDFRLPEGLDARTRAFCDLLRDADKVDILRAFCENDPCDVLDIAPGALEASPLSPAVVGAFWGHRTCRRDERAFPADYLVSYACFVFELVYPESRRAAREQGRVFELLSRRFDNEATSEEFARMLAHVQEWL